VNGGFEQRCEPGFGAVERADLAEKEFDRPIAGIAIHVLFDLVAQASAAAPEHPFKGRGENEIAFDHLHCTAFASKIIAEDARDISSCDLSQRWVAGFEHRPPGLVKGDVAAMSGDLQRQTRQRLLSEVLERQLDALPL
jgi:hypothetical protein